jgi:hypothetical protein
VAVEIYKNHALKCYTTQNDATDSWVPSISISWREADSFHVHTFDGPPGTFATAEDAIAYGYMLGRLWIDKTF